MYPRPIIRETLFDSQAEALCGTTKNADAALEGALHEFAYADDLTIYPIVDEAKQLRAYKSSFVPVADQIIIYFRLEEIENNERVTLFEAIKALRMSIPWSED